MGTLKLRDMKLRENNQRQKNAGEMRDMESAGKAEYGKSLSAKYWDFTHVI